MSRPASQAPGGHVGFLADQVEVVWLSGEDRLSFLARMSTQGLTDLASGSGRATAVLTDTGRVVDLVSAYVGQDGVALLTSGPGAAAVVAAQLRRYVMYRDKVRVTDAATQVVVWRLLGTGAAALAAGCTGLPVEAQAPGRWWRGMLGEDEVWALVHPDPAGLGGVDLVAPRGSAEPPLATCLREAGAVPLGPEDYAAERIAAGLPAFGHEIDGRANPLELGLRSVVDFAKGCYIGQEVVARLDSYDKVQRRLARLRTAAPIAAGQVVHRRPGSARTGHRATGRATTGRVTTVAPEPGGRGWLALAILPAGWADAAGLDEVTVVPDDPPGDGVRAEVLGLVS